MNICKNEDGEITIADGGDIIIPPERVGIFLDAVAFVKRECVRHVVLDLCEGGDKTAGKKK
ncbi:MAG: hypothetical protein NC548_44615 [Lachnospiraceae bacterium]|nr:hypothetical protein [Lachnospiraceae bacterium]